MQLREIFHRTPVTFSFEFFPPKGTMDALALGSTLGELKGLRPAFVSVTYGAGGSTQGLTADVCDYVQNRLNIPAMAHYTCVGADREKIKADLDGLAAKGIHNVMALRGDAPKGAASFPVVSGGFRHANELVTLVAEGDRFTIGVAGYPEKHGEAKSLEEDLRHLKGKLDAGGHFVVTQLFFDNAVYFDFVKRARALGIQARIIPGIMPITNFKQIKRMAELSGARIPTELTDRLAPIQDDPEAVSREGIAWAKRQCRELLDGGAPGIHFYTLNKSKATLEILREL